MSATISACCSTHATQPTCTTWISDFVDESDTTYAMRPLSTATGSSK
ncbi:MAG: hypothetical protein HOV81_09780 [Kofleriaceae bacterium]|nr:hypothetical protein [Kofleriaceae bacterium]